MAETDWVDPPAIAEKLGIAPAKVRRMAKEKIIPAMKVAGVWRLRWVDVERALKERAGYWQLKIVTDTVRGSAAGR